LKSKLIVISIFAAILAMSTLFATQAKAQGYYHNHNNNWVAPAIIGGIIGYNLAQPRYYPQPVIVQQPVYGPAPMCPYPYAPYYNQVLTYDTYGHQVLTYQFAGCR
jgi:hypothetical protein